MTADDASALLGVPMAADAGPCDFLGTDGMTALSIAFWPVEEAMQDYDTVRQTATDKGLTRIEDLDGVEQGYVAATADRGELFSIEPDAAWFVFLDSSPLDEAGNIAVLRDVLDAVRADR